MRRSFACISCMNLLDVVSSGLLKPASAMVKRYPDIGDELSCAVPLFEEPVCREGSQDQRPIPRSATTYTAHVAIIEVEGDGLTSTRALRGPRESVRSLIWYAGLVPARYIHAIHFRSEDSLRGHLALRLPGVDHTRFTYRVSPQHFVGTARPALDEIQRDAEQVRPRISRCLSADTLRIAGALSGAWLASASTAPKVMNGCESIQAAVEAQIELLGSHLLGQGRQATRDRRAFGLISRAILDWPRANADVFDLLVRFEGLVDDVVDDEERHVLKRYAERIRSVLEGDVLVHELAAHGLVSAKAFLLFVLVVEAGDLRSIAHHRLRPDQATASVARAYFGLRLGRSRMPADYRSEELDDTATLWEAAVGNSLLTVEGKGMN